MLHYPVFWHAAWILVGLCLAAGWILVVAWSAFGWFFVASPLRLGWHLVGSWLALCMLLHRLIVACWCLGWLLVV